MTDHEPTEIQVDVPPGVALEYTGARWSDGMMVYAPPPVRLPSGPLLFGGHHLGHWVVDTMDVRRLSDHHRGVYTATLRRVEDPPEREPLDDEFAAWIKRKRDQCGAGTTFDVLDDLLDEYRERRATGTPLHDDLED